MSNRESATAKLPVVVFRELIRTHALDGSSILAFNFLFSLMPLLIFSSALLGFLPIHDLFGQLLLMLRLFVPARSLATVEQIAAGAVFERHGGLLSFGLLTYLYSVTTAFATAIEALDRAYDVTKERPWWRERLQALLLAGTTGVLSLGAVLLLALGPQIGDALRYLLDLSPQFAIFWPILRVLITLAALITGMQLLYVLAPNRKQRYWSTLPGAVIAVIAWFLGSLGLQYYVLNIANYSKTYGSLGLVMGLMLWFYLIALAIVVGAEWNAEYEKLKGRREKLATVSTPNEPGLQKSA